MFRKIHSNRDPNDTLFSEIKREFGGYFGKAGTYSKQWLERRPRLTFNIMVVLLAASLTLSLTLFRKREVTSDPVPSAKNSAAHPAPAATLNDGFSRILRVESTLREMIALKRQVDSLTSKKALTHQDSLILEKDLDRLQQINHQQTYKSNGN